VRFGILTLTGNEGHTGNCEFVFFATRVEHLRDPNRRFTLTAADMALLNPSTRTCPVFRTLRDAEVTKAIYRTTPVLAEAGWDMTLRRLLNSADDSEFFGTQRSAGAIALYEGKHFHQFDHRWLTSVGDEEREVSDAERLDPAITIHPRFWYPAADIAARFGSEWPHSWALALRKITNSANERTFIASVVPSLAVSDSAKVFFMPESRLERVPPLLANFSALVLDYVARQKLSGWNMSAYVAEQIPVIPFGRMNASPPWPSPKDVGTWLRDRALELTFTTWDLEPFAKDVGYDGPPFRWDPDRRFLLRAELDAAFFHLYGISHDDADYILETFPIVKRNDEKAHGEYRTKRVILEIYDAMAEAIRTGKPYHTRLDPPPADPRVAHPPRTPVRAARPKVAVLPDRAWQRPRTDHASEVGVVLAALLKAFGRATPIGNVRLAAVLALHPALALASVKGKEANEWRRLVGDEAESPPSGVATITQGTNRAWGDAVRHLRGMRLLVEDASTRTWAPGAGLAVAIDTDGWADGRARWVVELIERRGAEELLQTVRPGIRGWVRGAEAA
jgi:hypothetical protein